MATYYLSTKVFSLESFPLSEAAEGSSVWGGKVSQVDTHKLDISTYIERTMSYYITII